MSEGANSEAAAGATEPAPVLAAEAHKLAHAAARKALDWSPPSSKADRRLGRRIRRRATRQLARARLVRLRLTTQAGLGLDLTNALRPIYALGWRTWLWRQVLEVWLFVVRTWKLLLAAAALYGLWVWRKEIAAGVAALWASLPW
jgi:hypothetical protein